MNKVILEFLLKILRIVYKNLGELITIIGLSIFIYAMFTVSRIYGLVALSNIVFIIGLVISKIHNPG